MFTKQNGIYLYSGDDTRAKWELKYYWEDGVTVECRYFRTRKSAQDFARIEGYPKKSYKIVPLRHGL